MKQIETKNLTKLPHNFQVRFALFCASQVRNGWKGIPECVEAIRMAELWLEDKATSKECKVAAYAASSTASAASYAAYDAALAAASAANASEDKAKLIKEQWAFYNELLHCDAIAEKALLGEEGI